MPDYAVIELLCRELDITLSELLGAREQKLPDNEEYSRMLYQIKELEQRVVKEEQRKDISFHGEIGVTFGSALAMIISYVQWKSIGWAILHGVFGWGYVIYYLIRY